MIHKDRERRASLLWQKGIMSVSDGFSETCDISRAFRGYETELGAMCAFR